jgi:ferritin
MPKLSKTLCDAVDEQIRNELSSAYLYLSMSAECAAHSLKGSAHWLRKQWEEELTHGLKLLDYVIERGNRVDLRTLEQPGAFRYESLTQVFETVLHHEQAVTKAIYGLYERAVAEKDYPLQTFLQWFIGEQIEEENASQEILDMVRLAGDQGAALLVVDRRLAERA